MELRAFIQYESDYIIAQIDSIVNEPKHYYLICSEPNNIEFKNYFIRDAYLLLMANIVAMLASSFRSWDRLGNIQGNIIYPYMSKVVKADTKDEFHYWYFITKLNDYYKILLSPSEKDGMEKIIERWYNCRKYFHESINASCKRMVFTDRNSPILATVLVNTCRDAANKLNEDPVI